MTERRLDPPLTLRPSIRKTEEGTRHAKRSRGRIYRPGAREVHRCDLELLSSLSGTRTMATAAKTTRTRTRSDSTIGSIP